MKVYSVFYLINYADTWRDADDIRRTDLGMFKKLEDAKKEVFNFVNKIALKYKYPTKEPKWYKCTDKRYPNSIYFQNTGSYAPTYIIQKVEVK